MFNPRKHRILSALLLATYVVASSASGLWHRHGEAKACASSLSHCDHHHDHASNLQAVAADKSPEPVSGASITASHQHDDCAICRFLAQRVISVTPPAIEDRGNLVTLLTIVESFCPFTGLARTTQARAPPCVG